MAGVRLGHQARDRRAFVKGVNAFVELCRKDPSHLPPEFRALDYLPAYWEPSDVARIRSHGLFYNLEQEVARALHAARPTVPRWRTCGGVREPEHAPAPCRTGLDV